MTITKLEGNVDVGQMDSIAINCYPEFVGSQDEQIVLVVPDTIPEDKDGKIITLTVTSSIPCIDFHNFDAMFHENHVVERIQDFEYSNDIGPHTVFARQERCLYFQYISVQSTHMACFKLFNYGIVPVNISIELIEDSLLPDMTRFNVFIIEPMYEQILPMNHKVFTVSFTPSTIETFRAKFHARVVLPPHLEGDELTVQLIGESCVPEVAITEPIHAIRETPCLNFPRTLIDEGTCKYFTLENVGFIKAKVIVEIMEDPNNVFTFFPCPDTQHLLQILEEYCNEPYNRCTVIRLGTKDVARFKTTFAPERIGKFYGKIRLHVIDNPYENLTINLEGDCYVEAIVLEGLPLDDNKLRTSNMGNRENYRRKLTSRQTSLSESNNQTVYLPYLTYVLDYGLCFVSKMYKKTFKIINKTTDRWFRFQWGLHNHVVFEPSTGHVKYLTFKEIVVTFLATEPKIHQNTPIECSICEILVENPDDEIAWDDRQTEVQWRKIYYDSSMNDDLLKKIVEPTMESIHNIVPGTTKILQLLLNANVAYSEYSCMVEEIFFKDTLMYQTREYTFTITNPGVVNMMYIWKINMDEQYPKRYLGESSNVNSRQKISESSSHVSKSFRGTLSAMSQRNYYEDDMSADDSKYFSQQCTSFITDSVDMGKGLSTTRPSDLFSSTAGLSGRTTDSWLEGDDLPFAIHPEMGMIPPGKSEECTLKFSPKDVFYYKAYLTCKIENLNPHLPILMIPVMARSLLPYCHFDVQESDYVSSGRRDAHLPGPVGYEIDDPDLWRNIRVIEFKVIGIGETHVRKFHLVNPTVDDYHFSWKNRTLLSGIEISNFHCTVTEGIAERGKRTDMSFTFLASDIGVFESFWLFSIERYNLECLFLVVGIVTEPLVYCLMAHVKLKPTILGFNVRESIKFLNNENFHIPFRVLEESLYSEGKFQKLSITPMTGTFVSKCEQHLWIEYYPTRVGEFRFYIQCAVKLMKKPITILVIASVYDISLSVSYCLNDEIVTAVKNKENVIDFGKIIPEIPITVKFDIKNTCKVAFYYSWELGITPEIMFRNSYTITVSQKQGHLTSENQCSCYLTLTTFQKIHIKNHCVLLKISNGLFYKFILKAFSKKPAIEFSFNRYDFGYCYIQENELVSYKTELIVTNTEDVSYVLECKYENKPYLSIDLNFISEALAAHSKITIPITFRPLKEIKYHECLVFVINSFHERKVTITGEGITYKIYLMNSRDKIIDLGNILPMKVVVKKIPIVNKGLASAKVKFGVMQYLGGYDDYYESLGYCNVKRDAPILAKASIMETKRSWTFDSVLDTIEPKLYEVLKIKPSTNVILKPNKSINVMIFFKPTARVKPFSIKVALQTNSNIIPLFLVRGSCVGTDFRLNRTNIFFGTVTQDCIEESKMILMNTGDLGSRFKWNVEKLPKEFQIIPMSGYCSVDTNIIFVVKFQPFEQKNIIEGEAFLEIEKHKSLNIKISGACCKLPDPTDTINFESFVREKQTRSVIIMNDSNAPWKLKIEVTGDYFSAEQFLQVPPLQMAPCVVTYAPIVMNTEKTLHKGSLVLKCPEENVYLIYILRGRSLPPQILENIIRRIPAKMKYTELLPVYNWLDRQQRFYCKIELLEDYVHDADHHDKQQVPIYSFVGNEKFDVPANGQRDYHAVFYCYEKWNFHFKITFTNEEQEYQFYEIEYEVTEPEVMESIKLTTTVRSEICYPLKFENPLNYVIRLNSHCFNPFVIVKVPRLMPPQSYDYISVYFNPLLPCDESVILNINSTYMGLFPYELQLKGISAPPENVTRVNAYLGNITEFTLILKNLTKEFAQFVIQVDNNCFTCPEIVEVNVEDVYMLKVIFEPYDVENVSATLTASSITAGEFIFPLIGSCSLPKPMGPYIITQTSFASISFKNVFRKVMTFNFIVDEPDSFTVSTSSITLNSKQSIVVNVNIKETEQYKEEKFQEEKYPVTGKLIVYCTDPEFSHINWVYYLRGIFE
ncbi:hydrocephalus-inducing protein-like [Apis dorsata]|uniref:hydrocephalus-inducing protein-like n=1 Tax=Apis dorsata TaxID=7462 RepID=UPI001293D7CB|nr:hydrocephalus-inducing protein-like [Apis dorsata]